MQAGGIFKRLFVGSIAKKYLWAVCGDAGKTHRVRKVWGQWRALDLCVIFGG